MIDSHVHLNRQEFTGEVDEVRARAQAAGVTGFLNVGYDLTSSHESIALAADHPEIRATVGVHPHDAETIADSEGNITAAGGEILAELEDLAARPEVVAIGEIGLDFFRDLSPRPAQYAALTAQLELANRVQLPVVFHIRDAWTETLAHLDTVGAPEKRGVLHAFSGDEAAVKWAHEHGFLLGIGGPVTYKKSHLPELVPLAGVEHILLETDAPWLPPVPHRGQRNESAYMEHTLNKVAVLLELSPEEVDRQTTASFARIFGAFAGTE
ncbi:MAG: TatD family hydrolase [Candidatus Krumholzibacteria bacterium]|nr:TatD family hydrolase [Candidatus Krumholzibacteria bacterium]